MAKAKISSAAFVTTIPEPPLSKFLFANTNLAWIWLLLRLYVSWQWISAGYEKVTSDVWTGEKAGSALSGFLTGAMQKTMGTHPDVPGWYGSFLHTFVLPHATSFSYFVSYGEVLVGVGLLVGAFTGVAAFFGALMNMNYLFSGSLSINPLLFIIELFLILAWRVAGWYGLDQYLLPLLGTPWRLGKAFKK